jgi:diacylglycerol kinase (ATP)
VTAAGTRTTGGRTLAGPVTVILNPHAGRKLGLPTNRAVDRDGVAALLHAVGLDADVRETSSQGEAIALVRDVAARTPSATIVAAGGDGTLRTVARTLLDASDGDPGSVPPIGILPLGSVMNVARSLGIPRDPEPAAEILARGAVRTIDVGEITGWGAFFEGVGVGLQAELLSAGASLDAGDRRATLRSIATALRFQPSGLALGLDDGRVVRCRSLVTSVANGPYAGIGFAVAPSARLDDGLFDVRVFEGFSRWELVRHFASIAAGRRRYEPRVQTYRSATVRLESDTPLRVRADGEEAGSTPVELRVLPRALRVIAPRT